MEKSHFRRLVALGGFALLFGVKSFAAPGDLDATYGQQGRVFYDVPGMPNAWAYQFFQQADGKTVAVGFVSASSSTATDTLIVRFNADGSLDTGFGNGGRVQIDLSGNGSYDNAANGVQQPDGKLLIAGWAATTVSLGGRLALLRLNTDGSLDTTFGTGGKTLLSTGSFASGLDVFLQDDTTILLAGYALNTDSDFVFARFSANGALDTSYGSGGVAAIDGHSSETMTRAIRQADGKIVAVGSSSGSMVAARVNTDGSIDTTFGVNGWLTMACSGSCQWTGVTQQPDGKLILSGYTSLPGTGSPTLQQEDSVVARYNADGSVDSTFGTNGYLRTLFARAYTQPVQSGERAMAAVVDSSSGAISVLGAITARTYDAGGSPVTAWWAPAVARVTASGATDATFGIKGFSILPFNSESHKYNAFIPRAINSLANGQLMVLAMPGEFSNPSTATAQSIAIARLTTTADYPGLLIAEDVGSVVENIGSVAVNVNREGGTTGVVSVDYTTQSDTASAGSDFVATSGTLRWEDGEFGSKRVVIPIVSDALVENSDESFRLVLSNPSGGAQIARSVASITIARDDVVPDAIIAVSQIPVSVSEGAGSVTLSVSRTGSGAGPVAVNYLTLNETAQFDTDYSPVAGILVWGSGDTTTKTISIPISNNSVYESDKDFNVFFLSPGGGAIYGGRMATVTIVNDDPAPQISIASTASVSESEASVTLNVTRSGATATTVSVNYATANGTATAGSDYTATSGTLTWLPSDPDVKTVTVPIANDSAYEGNEAFNVTLSNPTGGATLGTDTSTVTIADDDAAPSIALTSTVAAIGEGVAAINVNVTRTGESLLIHQIDYATVDGTAFAGSDYTATLGTLTWLPGSPDTKTISIPIANDALYEPTEAFAVVLSNPTGGATLGSNAETINIADDDPAPQVSIASSASVSESQSSVILNVTRSGATATTVSVSYSTADDTAAAGSDYTAASGTLSWQPADPDTKSISVPITNDSTYEGNEGLKITLSNPTGGATLANDVATITIVEDDSPPEVSIAPTVAVNESQSTATLNVTRSGATATTVSVNYATSNGTATAGSDYATALGTLTWLPTDPDTKAITVLLTNDTAVEGNETFSVVLSNPTGSATLGTSVSTVTIDDDDSASTGDKGGGGGVGELLLLLLGALTLRRARVRFAASN